MKRKLLSILGCMLIAIATQAQVMFSTSISTGADDAEEEVGSGTMYTNSSDLELVYDDFVTDNQLIGLRFTNVTIPKGAIIVNANIQFQVDELKANDPCNLFVFAENNASPATYTTANNNISGRMYFADSVLWSPPTWATVGNQGAAQRTADLSSLVQSVVNLNSWTSGNSMAFMLKGTGTRTAESYDGSTSGAPQLNITYLLPTQVAVTVGSSTDDAEEAGANATNTPGTIDLTSTDLELVNDGSDGDQWVGMRFENINVPAGSLISNAYIQFTVDETDSASGSVIFYAEAVDSSSTFTATNFDISSRTRTADSVVWTNIPYWGTVGAASADQQTPNLAALVQEIISRNGWKSGNALNIIAHGTGQRVAESYDGSTNGAPQLIIEYVPVNYTLQILHASDLEGGVEAIEDAPNFAALVDKFEDEYANSLTISSGDNWIPGPFFNAANEAPIQDSLRAILSDFYGMPLNDLTTASGRIDVSIMNVIGFNAATFGNHEFDAGSSAVEAIIGAANSGNNLEWMGAQFPYISANLDFSASNLAGYAVTDAAYDTLFSTDLSNPSAAANTKKIAPATIIERGGEKIGVIGATTQLLATISSPGTVAVVGNPTSNDMAQLAGILQPVIDSMAADGIDKIIVSSHLQQFALEQQLAGLLKGVDIIIAGGSDFLLADQTDVLRPGDVAAGQYPYLTADNNGDPVLIVSTDGQYSYVGRLVVGFDANGKILPFSVDANESGAYATLPNVVSNAWGGANAFANGTKGYYAERLTNSISDIVIAKDGNAFGKTNHFLEGRREYVRTEETNLGNLTADANLWLAKQYDSNVTVSLKNAGGIRAEVGYIDQLNSQLLPPQPNPVASKDSLEVSQLDIENTLRFNNELTVVETTPAGLKALLEHGISNWDGISTNGQMPQVGGVRFSFDPTATVGSKIQNLAIVDSAENVIDSVVVNGSINGNPSRVIKVVSLNFLVDFDGDGYPFSTNSTNAVDLDSTNTTTPGAAQFAAIGSEQNALAEYMAAKFAVTPYNEAETPITQDKRIQVLSLRNDEVFAPTNTNFTLQILHASDLEGGVEAIEDAPIFAAIVDTLEEEFDNTVIISSGDNWIPGPFFNAASEAPIEDSLRNILSDFYGMPLNDLTAARGRIDISLMNVIGFDASCFGNHEFDATTSAVEEIIFATGSGSNLTWMGAQFPYLSANLDFSASNLTSRTTAAGQDQSNFITDLTNASAAAGTKKIAPSTVIIRNGEKIGVVGATTQLLSNISSPGNVTVKGNPTANDMVQLAGILQPYIDSLVSDGVNKIIVTSHLQQFALEQQLAGLLNNVDVIIAGGSDFLLADGQDVLRQGDVAQGPYPYQTTNGNGDPLMIISTDGQYSYVGRLVIDFDANGVLIPASLDTAVSGAFATIPAVVNNLYGTANPYAAGSKGYFTERLTNSIKDIVIAKDGNIFGKTNFFLEGRREFVRTEETNMGDITADANLWMARKYDPTVAVSLKNGGGIRAEIGYIDQLNGQLLPPQPNAVAGKDSLEVSQLDIENTLRFNNALTVVETTPVGLKTLLEHGISNWDGISTNGQMPQIGGMEFSFDPTATAGSRIASMAIVDSAGNAIDSIVVNGAIHGDPNRVIKMVSLNFMVDNDGDGYPFSTTVTNAVDLDSTNVNHTQQAQFAAIGTEQNALAEYLLAEFSVDAFDMEETSPALDERIQILSMRNDSVLNTTNNIGIEEEHALNHIKMYPNPAQNVLMIASDLTPIKEVLIVNMQGARVARAEATNNMRTACNVAHLPAGHYIVQVKTETGTSYHRMVVAH